MRLSIRQACVQAAVAILLAAAAGANANAAIGDDPGFAQLASSGDHRSAAACAALAGAWHNVDPTTDSITHIQLAANCAVGKTRVRVSRIQVWGSCQPSDCAWPAFSGVYDARTNAIVARSRASFKVTDLSITPDAEGNLVVTTFNHFIDNSGRADYTSVDTMER